MINTESEGVREDGLPPPHPPPQDLDAALALNTGPTRGRLLHPRDDGRRAGPGESASLSPPRTAPKSPEQDTMTQAVAPWISLPGPPLPTYPPPENPFKVYSRRFPLLRSPILQLLLSSPSPPGPPGRRRRLRLVPLPAKRSAPRCRQPELRPAEQAGL